MINVNVTCEKMNPYIFKFKLDISNLNHDAFLNVLFNIINMLINKTHTITWDEMINIQFKNSKINKTIIIIPGIFYKKESLLVKIYDGLKESNDLNIIILIQPLNIKPKYLYILKKVWYILNLWFK